MQIEVHKIDRNTHEIARRLARHVGGNLRAPHHTVSGSGLVGELAIAAGGVLMLDEIDEFLGRALLILKNHSELMQDEHRPVLFVTHLGDDVSDATKAFLDELRKLSSVSTWSTRPGMGAGPTCSATGRAWTACTTTGAARARGCCCTYAQRSGRPPLRGRRR